jgi:hypothetical protein
MNINNVGVNLYMLILNYLKIKKRKTQINRSLKERRTLFLNSIDLQYLFFFNYNLI